MASTWAAAGDGTGVTLAAVPGRKSWRRGDYELTRLPRGWHPFSARGRWAASHRNERGVGGCRTPLGALWALRRWLREDQAGGAVQREHPAPGPAGR